MNTLNLKAIAISVIVTLAAVLTSCHPDEPVNPLQPEQGGNNKPAKAINATIAIGLDSTYLQIADLYIVDSITGQAGRPVELTVFYTDAEATLTPDYQTFRTEPFEGSRPIVGAYIQTELSADKTLGVRTEIRLKDNALDILKTLDPESTILMGSYCAFASTASAPQLKTMMSLGGSSVASLITSIESNPDRLNTIIARADLQSRNLSGTFYAADEVVCMK